MTAPDYSKCWNCGKPAIILEGLAVCQNKACYEYRGMLLETWRVIHDRIAAEREAATKAERERIAQLVTSLYGAGGVELADRIRKGE